MSELDRIARAFVDIASDAGAAMMPLFGTQTRCEKKIDCSPVTEADRRAHETISTALAKAFPGVHVVSEEGPLAGPTPDAEFILVDPLDGTKEFIAGRAEFTVNIALVRADTPVAGVVYAPALETVYFAGSRAWCGHLPPGRAVDACCSVAQLSTRPYCRDNVAAVASYSHLDPATDDFLRQLSVTSRLLAGSSLKFCYVAAGLADVYPRFGPTMEWDTAAGQAIVQAAGGQVLTPSRGPLRYRKFDNGLVNDSFVVWGRLPDWDGTATNKLPRSLAAVGTPTPSRSTMLKCN
jgi:3'(2'), 5'-bisphosphate nucleotidase